MRNAPTSRAPPSKIGYTFNWFYVDDKDIAYFNSGNNPVRATGHRPAAARPRLAAVRVAGLQPGRQHGATTRRSSEHPQVVNQHYLTSWNNKQAAGYAASTRTSTARSTARSRSTTASRRASPAPRRSTLPELVDAMEDAGTIDLRGDQVLPWALTVLGRRPTRGSPTASASSGPGWPRRAPARPRPRRHLRARRGDPHHGRLVAALVEAEFEPRARPGPLRRHDSASTSSTTRPTTTATTSAPPIRTAGTASPRRTCAWCSGRRCRARTPRTFCGNGVLAPCRARSRSRCPTRWTTTPTAALRLRPGLQRRQALRRSDVLRRHPPASARRSDAAAHPVDQPADLSAGRLGRGPPAALGNPAGGRGGSEPRPPRGRSTR